ncbi:MAG: ketoacyl-ACP synthase III [Succinivibrio sp.]|nr:ketoacyl-ACP synthase III [Succinivibrio sp.]
MNICKVKGVRLEAVAACVPEHTVYNREFASSHFSDDLEATLKAIGIRERHIALKEETTAIDLCVAAARRIFDSGAIRRDEIGAVIFVTMTPDCLAPNNSTYVQHLLGLESNVAAYDISHACPGYVFGLWNAALVAANMQKKVLLLDGDINSRYVSPWDRSTALLFGDAGTASVVSPCSGADDWYFTFASNGAERDSIVVRIGMRYPLKREYLEYVPDANGNRRRFIDMEMHGQEVFEYVTGEVSAITGEFLAELKLTAGGYERLYLHQANLFMMKRLAKTLGFDRQTQMAVSLDKYGNTSSASIPLTVAADLGRECRAALLVGMGAGMACAVGSISLRGLNNLGIVQLKC